jgi:hypothetical protein
MDAAVYYIHIDRAMQVQGIPKEKECLCPPGILLLLLTNKKKGVVPLIIHSSSDVPSCLTLCDLHCLACLSLSLSVALLLLLV